MKVIKKGQDARDAIKRGIDAVADCVKTTLGPAGRNAVLGRISITPIITNDGVTIARNIECEDEIEELGAMMVKEASVLADNKAGDGTTTTTVLLQSIVSEAFEQMKGNGSIVGQKVDTIKLKKEIDLACSEVVKKLKESAQPITKENIYDVALVSVEYEHLAKIVSEVFEKVGVDGFVTVEEGLNTGYEVFKGLEIKAGYPSEYFVNNDKRECVLEQPYILVTNNKLEDIKVITPLVETLVEKKINNLIIVAPEFSPDFLNRLVATKLGSPFNGVALKLPTFDDNGVLIDIATLTNAKFLDRHTFVKFEDFVDAVKFENLGTCEKAVIGRNTTLLIGGDGEVAARIEDIKSLIEKSASVFDRKELERRLAYLSGGIATIRISAESDFEKGYFKLKLEDAVNAVQNALRDGVVKGGGLALKEISEALPQNILTKSLLAPHKQIQENAGGKLEIGERVIDPVKITISALEAACSLAGMVLTTEIAVANKNESKDKNQD